MLQQREDAVWAQNAPDFRQSLGLIRYAAKYQARESGVKGSVGKGQLLCPCPVQLNAG